MEYVEDTVKAVLYFYNALSLAIDVVVEFRGMKKYHSLDIPAWDACVVLLKGRKCNELFVGVSEEHVSPLLN